LFDRHGVLDLGRGRHLLGELSKCAFKRKDAEGTGKEALGDSHRAQSFAKERPKTQVRSLLKTDRTDRTDQSDLSRERTLRAFSF
jgi:hypothetical protein